MKREIPLIIIDRNRKHNIGECDFIVCTDKDNGFVARVDYIEEEKEETGDNYRIGIPRNGMSVAIKIVRHTGTINDTTQIRSLLKRAMKVYEDTVTKTVNIDKPSIEDCVKFLNILIDGNRHNINEVKSLNERQTVMTSIAMLEHIRDYLVD